MRRQLTSLTLMICGVLVLAFGLTMMPTPPAAMAAPAFQPSPRPTLEPTPDFRPTTPPTAAPITPSPSAPTTPPTTAPTTNAGGDGGETNDKDPTPVPYGRVTGTVIDLRTGNPTPNIVVAIDNVIVVTDRNGNYDRWLPSGYYVLGLELGASQGNPTQGPQRIAVGPGDTVVVHLFFTSLSPTAVLAPSTVPPAESPAPTESPVAVVAPSAPAPVSSGGSSPATRGGAAPASGGGATPSHLPHTAFTMQGSGSGFWILMGVLLLGVGTVLQFGASARHRPRRGSHRTTTRCASNAKQSDDEHLLSELFDRDL